MRTTRVASPRPAQARCKQGLKPWSLVRATAFGPGAKTGKELDAQAHAGAIPERRQRQGSFCSGFGA